MRRKALLGLEKQAARMPKSGFETLSVSSIDGPQQFAEWNIAFVALE
jgi:hypothetical protein